MNKLITLLGHQCSLTEPEARLCIRLAKKKQPYGSEAINSYGGVNKCIQDAIKSRRRLYKLYNGPLEYWFSRQKICLNNYLMEDQNEK